MVATHSFPYIFLRDRHSYHCLIVHHLGQVAVSCEPMQANLIYSSSLYSSVSSFSASEQIFSNESDGSTALSYTRLPVFPVPIQDVIPFTLLSVTLVVVLVLILAVRVVFVVESVPHNVRTARMIAKPIAVVEDAGCATRARQWPRGTC
jgi:hypothetical protein